VQYSQSFRHAQKSGLFCAVPIPAKAKIARKQDIVAATDEYAVSSEDSSGASGDEATTPSEILYGFDSPRVPSHGSQILNTALAKAIEQYEDKETVKLVRNEYEILDADEEEAHNLGHVSVKPKLMDAEDAEYEFV
jgi:cation transport regulator ChaB